MAQRKINIDTGKIKLFKDNKNLNKLKPYPDSNIAPDKKTNAYHLEWAEKIYSLFLNKNTWIPNSIYNRIDELRSWSDGVQDTTEVLEWIIGKKETPKEVSAFDASGYDTRDDNSPESKRKAWANIDKSPVSVFPKIKTKINEHIRSMYYEMSVNAIDSYSVALEEGEKHKLWLYSQNKKWFDTQQAMAGINPQEEIFLPENYAELELYASTGGFKVPYSISMEDLLKHTFDVSGWDKDVAEKIRSDLMTLGYTIIKEIYDPEIKRVIVEYCDAKYAGVQYGKKGYKDSEYGYELEWVEVSKIRKELNLDLKTAASLAYTYSGIYGNPSEGSWSKYNNIHSNDAGDEWLDCDFYKVPVFHFEFIDIDNESYISFTDNFGNKRAKKYQGELQDNEKLESSKVRYVREGKWVVGTEYLYKYGKKSFIPRDNFNRPRISFRAIRLNTEPLLQQVLPFLKGIQLSWMKIQNSIALAVANGYAVDIGAIKNISIGKGSNWDPMEVFSYYRQTGILMYRNQPRLTSLNRYSSPPVIPMQNQTYENIKMNFESMKFFIQAVEETSGISMISTGKTPDPDVAKFNMQISIQGTNDIINNITRAQTDLQEDISVNICYRIRSLCRKDERILKSYENVIGKFRMKVIVEAEKNHVDYGISIEASDITEEKRNIMALIQMAITPTGSGDQAKLGPGEGIQVIDMVHQRQNLRRIGLIVGYKLRRKERELHQKQLELIQAQGAQVVQMKLTEARAKEQETIAKRQQAYEDFRYKFILQHQQTPEQALTKK